MDLKTPPTVAVIGVGLMGGSLALAAKARLGATVRGYSQSRRTLERALERGAIDVAAGDITEALEGADFCFVAVPVGVLVSLTAQALEAASPGCVVSDMGSTKQALVARFGRHANFIGGHPLCGSESSGIEAARADLFEGAPYFLTPTPAADPTLHSALHLFLSGLGARPTVVSPLTHDDLMALVSHLPHVIANVLMDQVAAADIAGRGALFGAGPSFRDLTRIAGSNPRVWVDIFLENKESLLQALVSYRERLQQVADAIRTDDAQALYALIDRAAQGRNRLLAPRDEAELHSLRFALPNKPGVLSEITLKLGEASLNILDLRLHHLGDRGGEIELFFAGTGPAHKAGDLLRLLGYDPRLTAVSPS